MSGNMVRVAMALAGLLGSAGAALADDCAPVRAAMTATAQMPYTTTATKTDAGKKTTGQIIQTATTKYVQTASGKWYAMPISSKDLLDNLKTLKLTCQRAGTDNVNGQAAAVYNVHTQNEDSSSDSKVWISAKPLILKSEMHVEGTTALSIFDYAHVQPPANATKMGGR